MSIVRLAYEISRPLLILLLSALPLLGCSDSDTLLARAEWTLGVGGDTVLCRRVEMATERSGNSLHCFGDTVQVIRSLDVFFCNLECQISNVGKRVNKAEKRPFYFRASPLMIRSIRDAGIDVVTVANNHGMDYGPEALLQTLALCRENGIIAVGGGSNASEAEASGIVAVSGLKVAFIGFQSTNPLMAAGPSTPGLNSAKYQESDQFVRRAKSALDRCRKQADVVVFTVHWGPNYRTEPTDLQRAIARDILDLGYDVFIAHSSHQFLGVEIHDGKPIIHDAGNFIVDFKPVPPHWNDRNMIFIIHFNGKSATKVEAVPIVRKGEVTNIAKGPQAHAIAQRFILKCGKLQTYAEQYNGTSVIVPVNQPQKASKIGPA